MRHIALRLTLCLSLAAASACPGPEPQPDATADVETDTLPGGRTFLMGGLAQTYDFTVPRRWVISAERLMVPAPATPDAGVADAAADGGADDAGDDGPTELTEAVVVPLYHLGIPWDEFDSVSVSSLPGPWVKAINEAKVVAAETGKPIALALSPTSLEWDNLAPRASDNGTGGLQIQENWLLSYCHDPSQDSDPAQWRDAYVRYVQWVTGQFDPQYVFLAHRINRYDERCSEANPGAYAAIAEFVTAAHDKLKASSDAPTTVVTVDVEDLYGYTVDGKKPGRCVTESPQECFEQRKTLLDAFTADRLGLESYPGNVLRFIQSIPTDWLDRVASYRTDMDPLIAGTGLGSERIETSGNVCVPLLESDQALQLSWLDQVFGVATAHSMELVVWSSPLDQLDARIVAPCQCSGDFETCEHLSQLGSKSNQVRLSLIDGLYTFDGEQREAGRVWVEQLSSP